MSRKVLIVAVVVALSLASFSVPAMGAPDSTQDVAPEQLQSWSMPAGDASALWLPMQLSGGSECGGGAGCPT